MAELDQQIKAYEARKEELEKLYPGKVVVFANGEFQGSYDDAAIACFEASKKFKLGTFMVRPVGRDEATLSASVMYGV